jgi:GTP-binding protein EngB required for normal cell division
MSEKPSLLIIGNSNVGKSSITRLLLPNPRKFKGKIGKHPGSTLLIKPITQTDLPYIIIDLPGFGYIRRASHRREEHIKKQIVIHIEKHHHDYFFGLVVINILRIKDEIEKYFINNQETIPLNFELIKFLREFEIPIIVIFNKIDKVSDFDKSKNIQIFVESAEKYDLNLVHLDDYNFKHKTEIPYLEISALKKMNIIKLKEIVQKFLRFTS